MKDKLKKIPIIKKIVYLLRKVSYFKEFFLDYIFFINNYANSKNNLVNNKYKMLLLVHSIEKGMTNSNPRCFGKNKIEELIKLYEENYKDELNNDFEFILAYNVLDSYKRFYEKNKFTENEEYYKTCDFLEKYKNIKKVNTDSILYKKSEVKFDYNKFISSKRSVRKYSEKKIEEKTIKDCAYIAIKSPSACNRQMCKLYFINGNKRNEVIKFGQGFSNFELENASIFLITFDIASFTFIGERNQGYLNCGIFATNFVNALHSYGIGSCMLQFGNRNSEEKKLKRILNIPKNERIALLVSAGYYMDECMIPASIRKELNDFYKKI